MLSQHLNRVMHPNDSSLSPVCVRTHLLCIGTENSIHCETNVFPFLIVKLIRENERYPEYNVQLPHVLSIICYPASISHECNLELTPITVRCCSSEKVSKNDVLENQNICSKKKTTKEQKNNRVDKEKEKSSLEN